MKKHANKQPVDDLFVRKLENMSLPPSPDSFAQLQARMGGRQPEVRTMFWRKPAIQQYMAIAASVLLCLFGWLYLSTGTTISDKTAIAVNKSTKLPMPNQINEQLNTQAGEQVAITRPVTPSEIAGQTEPRKTSLPLIRSTKPASNNQQLARLDQSAFKSKPESQNLPAVGSATQTEQFAQADSKVSPAELTPEKQLATASKPMPVAERVLIVTIAEPEALVAARQAVTSPTTDKVIVATASKPEPEARTTTIWQQVKRLKQGEVFARKDAVDDERGLIGRAYSGLKHTFDKDKSVKQ